MGDGDRTIVSGSFKSSRGFESIYFKRSLPKNFASEQPIVHLFMIHGVCEYHQRHDLLPRFLIERIPNMIISWMDHKGHGLSSGTRCHVQRFDEYCEDVIEFINIKIEEEVSEDWSHSRNFVFGHSMGGLIVLKSIFDFRDTIKRHICGLIFSNPSVRTKIQVPFWVKEMMIHFSPLLGKLRIANLLVGKDLCTDRQLAEQYDGDHLINKFMTIALLREIFMASKSVRTQSYFLDIPALFLLSEDDQVVDPAFTELFCKGIDPSLCTVKNYSMMKHEVFNNLERDTALLDVYNWMEKYIKKVVVYDAG